MVVCGSMSWGIKTHRDTTKRIPSKQPNETKRELGGIEKSRKNISKKKRRKG